MGFLPILIQEFVHGSEVNVCGAGDGKGNLIGAVPMRKLYITDKGIQVYDIGKMFIRYSYDFIVDMKEFEQISTIGEL